MLIEKKKGIDNWLEINEFVTGLGLWANNYPRFLSFLLYLNSVRTLVNCDRCRLPHLAIMRQPISLASKHTVKGYGWRLLWKSSSRDHCGHLPPCHCIIVPVFFNGACNRFFLAGRRGRIFGSSLSTKRAILQCHIISFQWCSSFTNPPIFCEHSVSTAQCGTKWMRRGGTPLYLRITATLQCMARHPDHVRECWK